MSASETVSAAGLTPGPAFAGGLLARLRGLLPRSINASPLLTRSGEPPEEPVVARHGVVEIRRTVTAWALETCVKGEPERARETALRRLANYAAGRNNGNACLQTVRPMVQSLEAPGRWRVRIGLADTDTDLALSSACNGKVRLRVAETATLAVISLPGRPTPLAMKHAETAILQTIATTQWDLAGTAMLRLNSLPVILPFLGRFEVAVPVAERSNGSTQSSWSRSIALRDPATASSPSVH
jgi:hypothetical protein